MHEIDVASFATHQLGLLHKELQAELDETELLTSTYAPTTLQRAGLAVLNLCISSQRTGFGGKTILELSLDPAVSSQDGDLPEHGLRVGDICSVAEQPKGAERKKERESMEKRGVNGVVTKVQKAAIHVALDKEDPDVPSGGKLWLVKLANDVTYKRLSYAMTKLQKMQASEHSILTQVLFGSSSAASVPDNQLPTDLKWHDPTLNESQKAAIAFALAIPASGGVALIHGPPGTGKTHTLIELILQFLSRKQRVLVCGPSNISVDNIVERLAPHKVPMLRLGHPARLLPSVLDHSIEVLTRTSDAAKLVSDVRADMDTKQAEIRKTRNARERRGIYVELKELRTEFREREGRIVSDLVRGSRVVLCTLHGAGGRQLRGEKFDVVVVDEASQALEAQCWIPLLESGAGKLVLAGDHMQLGPTIKSLGSSRSESSKEKNGPKEKKKGSDKKIGEVEQSLEQLQLEDEQKSRKGGKTLGLAHVTLESTLFDRLLSLHGHEVKRMLTTQYRMHEKIMAFPSRVLYEKKLVAADKVKTRLLKDLPYGVQDTDDTREPLIFLDTQGGDFPEKAEDNDGGAVKGKGGLLAESKVNEAEATVVRAHIASLVEAGVKTEDIAVVTPYNGQLALLSEMLRERFAGLELGSVDGFQGREKEAVVVSLVRSNPNHEVGFLGERRRLNVAMTRPKRHLCVVGDSETISRYVRLHPNIVGISWRPRALGSCIFVPVVARARCKKSCVFQHRRRDQLDKSVSQLTSPPWLKRVRLPILVDAISRGARRPPVSGLERPVTTLGRNLRFCRGPMKKGRPSCTRPRMVEPCTCTPASTHTRHGRGVCPA